MYTRKIAVWCLKYTIKGIEHVRNTDSTRLEGIFNKIDFKLIAETSFWEEIIENMYLPESKTLGIFLQQDGYLDKKQILAKDLDAKIRPLNQHWSWDNILRSCFIKQADVLQGIYFFEHEYDIDTIERNYEFYESRTVHESSLSPCIHSILASKIEKPNKAYNLFLRTSRLDLDDYNREVKEGLHITSMAGTWLSIVEGFGGLRIIDNKLSFSPCIPDNWHEFSFKIYFRGNVLDITVGHIDIMISNAEGEKIDILVNGTEYPVEKSAKLHTSYVKKRETVKN